MKAYALLVVVGAALAFGVVAPVASRTAAQFAQFAQALDTTRR